MGYVPTGVAYVLSRVRGVVFGIMLFCYACPGLGTKLQCEQKRKWNEALRPGAGHRLAMGRGPLRVAVETWAWISEPRA